MENWATKDKEESVKSRSAFRGKILFGNIVIQVLGEFCICLHLSWPFACIYHVCIHVQMTYAERDTVGMDLVISVGDVIADRHKQKLHLTKHCN